MSERYAIELAGQFDITYYDVVDTTIPDIVAGRLLFSSESKIKAQNYLNELLGLPKELTRKELKARNADLEARVKVLEARIKELESKQE